jgi:TonB family protein
MKYSKTKPVIAALVALISLYARASNVKVIANVNVPADTISAQELKSVFLAEKSSLRDGTRVEPVFAKGGPAHETFLREYLHESDDQLQNYFRSLVFSGRHSMPKSIGSDAEVVAYVAKNKGAIGYVSAEANTNGVKSLDITDLESAMRRLLTRVEPEYPDILRKNRIGGTVRLEVTIAANGSVQNVTLLGGNPALGDPAMAAVKKWVYAPGRSRERIEVSIPFNPDR